MPVDVSESEPEAVREGRSAVHLAVLPLGATEQHGAHLPTDTDAAIAAAVSAGLDERLGAGDGARFGRGVSAGEPAPMTTKVLPAQPFGASGEHAGFPGLASIGTEVLVAVLLELGRSVCEWAERLLIVNAHGGNLEALAIAVPQLRAEGREVAWFGCATAAGAGDTHAGRGETAIMLALDPEKVHAERAEAGCTRPIGEILPELRTGGVAAVSPNGVLGDPRGADAEEGRALLDRNVAAVEEAVLRWVPATNGRLATTRVAWATRHGAGST